MANFSLAVKQKS